MGQQSKQRCPMSCVQFYSTYIHFFNRLTKVTEEQEHFPANHQSITGPRQRDSQPFNVTVTKDSFQMTSEATMLTTSTTVLDTRYCCKYTTIAKADNETKYNNNVHCDQNSISTHKPPPAPPTHTNSFRTTPHPLSHNN